MSRLIDWFAPTGIPLAWRQLAADKKRLAAAVMGVTFGLMLMLFQLGLYNGILAMVVSPHEALRGELVMASPNFEYFGSNLEFSRRRLYQARSLPEVEAAAPLYLGFVRWWNPETGRIKMMFAMGINPDENPFAIRDIRDQIQLIRDPESVLFDRTSQKDYGPVALRVARGEIVETHAEAKRIKVKGLFTLGHTLAASANVVMSDEAYFRLRPDKPRNMPNVAMIKLAPGSSAGDVQRKLRAILPDDVQIYTREEFMSNEQIYWAKRTPVGFVASAGMLVGMLVGAIVVYQILYADVNDHLKEYATLKAIGYRDGFFARLVLQEALILVLLAFIPALLFTLALNHWAREAANIPVSVAQSDILRVFGSATTTCLVGGMLATRKLRSADPADVF
ncbi:MAG: ABC transporter permease DevC [Bryobacteraceae bacterium]